MKNRTTATVTATIAAVALALTGCSSGSGGSVTDETPSGTNAPSDADDEFVEEYLSEEGESSDEDFEDYEDEGSETDPAIGDEISGVAPSDPADFGQSVTFPSGVSVTVSEPSPYTYDDEMDFGGEGYPHHVKFTIKVVNNTGAPFDASLVSTTAQSSNVEGDEIYGDTVGEGLTTMLLDGREGTFDVAYGVQDPDDIVLQVETWDDNLAYALFETSE